MPTNKAPFNIHLDETVLQKIKVIAKNETRSASNFIEHICKQCVKDYEEDNGEIEITLGE